MAFQAGYDKFVRWTRAGTTTALNVTGHSWSEQIDALDVTSSGSGGIQTLLAGILRGDGNVKANFDNLQILSNPVLFIAAGVQGFLEFFFGGGIPYTVPCMVTKLVYQTAVEGKVEWNFDVRLDGGAGTYVRMST